MASDGQAISCDSEFFRRVVTTGERASIDVPRLDLLASLFRPGKSHLRRIREKTFDVDSFDNRRGQFGGYLHDITVAQAFRHFETYAASPECQLLQPGRDPGRTIARIELSWGTAPGMDWFEDFELSTLHGAWTLVLAYDDAENLQENAFPRILGFAHRGDFPWSVARVLTDDSSASPSFRSDILAVRGRSPFDQRLLILSWVRGDDDPWLGADLLRMERKTFDVCSERASDCTGMKS